MLLNLLVMVADTTGIGDLSFLADSLDCGMMACETPIANLLRYGACPNIAC